MSSGVAYDGQLCIWDWQGGSSLCRHYAGAELHGVAFSEDASSVISVGKDHLKVSSSRGLWSCSFGDTYCTTIHSNLQNHFPGCAQAVMEESHVLRTY